MNKLKTYNQLFENKEKKRETLKTNLINLFEKYDFDYMFVGWSDGDMIIDEIIKEDKDLKINGKKMYRFYLSIDELDSDVIDELDEWFADINLQYLFENSRFDIENIIKILKVEKTNVETIEKWLVDDILESLNDEDELENVEFQESLITENFILGFFEIAYEYKLKNYIKNKFSNLWKKFIKEKSIKKFKI